LKQQRQFGRRKKIENNRSHPLKKRWDKVINVSERGKTSTKEDIEMKKNNFLKKQCRIIEEYNIYSKNNLILTKWGLFEKKKT